MTRRIVGLAGSLRTASLNLRLLRAAVEAVPSGLEIVPYRRFAEIPLFSEELEAVSEGNPPAVRELREVVRAADGVLIATPEYNQSLPGVLKNAIDWLSRPGPDEVLERKPVAIMGATTGPWGTRHAQKELRHVLAVTGAYVMPQPMLFVPRADDAFDAEGRLADERVAGQLSGLLDEFAGWIELVGSGTAARRRGAA